MERWRKPIRILALEEDPNSADMIGGKWYRGVKFATDAEGWRRIREGWVCVMCTEPQERPFPEACSLCGYRMADRQTKDLEVEFVGEDTMGPSTTLRQELDRLDDTHERRLWTPKGTIVVERGLNGNSG